MKYNKRTFIIVGLVLGLLCGVLLIIKAYAQSPSLPGIFELSIQILILGLLGAVGLAFGFIVYSITTLFLGKEKGMRKCS
jgi:Na+(H+)/acetate symporter ActP